jgi:LuxR family glucitol operon transcriptional activator
MLDPDGQRVLMAMVLFPQSACTDALRATAGIERRAFRRVIEQLRDMALVDVQQMQEVQTDNHERYILHPLTRTFARAMLNQRPELEGPARHNLARWCIALAEQVGYVPQDLAKLALLDPEQDLIPEVLRWMLQSGYYHDAIALASAARYYYYIRGHWKMEPSINMVRFEAARHLSDKVEQVEALAYQCQLLSKQGYIEQIGPVMEQLDTLAQETDLPDAVRYEYHQALALCHRALGHYTIAQQIWDDSINLAESISTVAYLVNRRDFSDTLQMQEKYREARQLLNGILPIAQKGEYGRIVLSIEMRLARIDIRQEHLDDAERRLAACRIEEEKLQDRTYLAELLLLSAQLHKLHDDLAAARSDYMDAINHYERLGKFTAQRLAEEELVRLDDLDTGE